MVSLFSKLIDSVLKNFLLFPKLSVAGSQGVLIGEIFLGIYIVTNFGLILKQKLSNLIISFLLFSFIFFCFSSLIIAFHAQTAPVQGIVYFLRIVLYISLITFFLTKFSNTPARDVFFDLIIRHFYLCWIISFIIFVYYFLKRTPSALDILTNYQTGYKLIPIFGLTFNPTQFHWLETMGASGIILSSWAVLVFHLTYVLGLEKKMKVLAWGALFLTPVLTLSRSGLASALISVFVLFLLNGKERSLSKFFLALLISGLFLIAFDLFISYLGFVSIFERVFLSSDLNLLSTGRFQRIVDTFGYIRENPFAFFVGLGNDFGIREFLTSYRHSESFLMDILQGCGLLGVISLLLYFYVLYSESKKNSPLITLIYFYIAQMPVCWAIGGGDFFSPTIIFCTLVLFAGHFFIDKRRKYEF